MLSETACKANAFGMTYLGEKALFGEGEGAALRDRVRLLGDQPS